MIFNPELIKLIDTTFENSLHKSLAKILILAVKFNVPFISLLDTDRINVNEVYNKLLVMGFLRKRYKNKEPYLVVDDSVFITVEQLVKSKENTLNKITIEKFLNEKAHEFRAIFTVEEKGKKGLKPGVMGDYNAIRKNLKKWFYDTKFQYSWDQVLNATRAYVKDCKKDNYLYLQRAHYFIYKNNESTLSGWIDEYGDVNTTINNDKNVIDL